MLKKVLAALLCAATLVSLCACKPSEEPSSSAPSSSESSSSVPEVVHLPINLMSGCEGLSEEAVGKRPVAVMINNINGALPQYGIAAADIMVETLVEGGITRMMAVYGDYTKIPDVCTIRSARFYYPIIALSFDAVYVHWGAEENYAMNTIYSLGVDRLAGDANTGNIFARDEQRRADGYALEHTGYMKGEMVPAAIDGAGIRSDLKDGYTDTAFTFAPEGEPVVPTGDACTQALLDFSGSYYSTFDYDAAGAVYKKCHNGDPHMDGKANTQLAFTNVLALETSITGLTGVLMDVEVTGSGTGYWFSQGKCQKINWSKADEYSKIVLTDDSGSPLTINAGKTYIGFIRPDCTTIELPAAATSSSAN